MKLSHALITNKYTSVHSEDGFDSIEPCYYEVRREEDAQTLAAVRFQRGPIKEHGVNGACNEDIIAMVIDRLEHFQKSDLKCIENAEAITKLQESLMWLKKRITDREKRNEEDTSNL